MDEKQLGLIDFICWTISGILIWLVLLWSVYATVTGLERLWK